MATRHLGLASDLWLVVLCLTYTFAVDKSTPESVNRSTYFLRQLIAEWKPQRGHGPGKVVVCPDRSGIESDAP
jgi:hypothetical protein